MNTVQKQFEDRAIVKSEIMLFSKEDALLFVKSCKHNDIQILGIDAFYIIGEKIRPSLVNSIDFTSKYFKMKSDNVHSEAIEFLQSKDFELYFEIVCR
jgi:hypothetical protein